MKNTVILKTLQSSQGKNLVFTNPVKIITTHYPEEVAECLVKIATALEQGYYAVGFITYECGCLFDNATQSTYREPALPLLWFGIYKAPQEIVKPRASAQYNDYHISELTMAIGPEEYKKKY